jgi:Kef-type K+ transport system membrane component KefB
LLHADLTEFLTASVGLLSLLCVCLFILGRLGVGSVVAFLVAGLVLGRIHHLTPETARQLHEIADLGVVLLLFAIGLEMTPPQLRGLGRDAATLGVPQIAASAAVIGWLVFWQSAPWEIAVMLGLAFSLSSTIVVLQLLEDRRELHSFWGRKTFAILLTQDLAAVPLLVMIPIMAGRGIDDGPASPWYWAVLQAGVVIGGIVAVGRFALTRVFAAAARQANEPAFICSAFLAVFVAALASEYAGLSMALGTFLLGAVLSASPFGHRLAAIVEPAKNALLALFFLNIGASVNFEVVAASWLLLLLNIVVILVLKFAVMFALGLLSGIPVPDVLRMALALSQCGEFGFVLFATAQAGGLMTPELSALASVLIAISMLTTPLLMRLVVEPRPAGA